MSLHIGVGPGTDGSGAPGPGTVSFTAAPALHATNLSPWPLRIRAPGALPRPGQDPRACPTLHAPHTLKPGATLALPVLWAAPGEAAGEGAASKPSAAEESSAGGVRGECGPAVEVSLATVNAEPAAEWPEAAAEGPLGAGTAVGSAAEAVPGYGDAGVRDATCNVVGDGMQHSGVVVPLLGGAAAIGQRRRVHLAACASAAAAHRMPGSAAPSAWDAAAKSDAELGSCLVAGYVAPHDGRAGRRGGMRMAAVVTHVLLARNGRMHLVLFRDAQPTMVLRNDSLLPLEVAQHTSIVIY